MLNLIEWIKKILKINELKEIREREESLEEAKDTYENYYNNKYPKADIAYKRTDLLGTKNIDARQFLSPRNFQLPCVLGKTDDEKALNCLDWIKANIKYTMDSNQYKKGEYWAFGYETFASRLGDCEDGAILLYDLMRHNGIPAWKIRITAGYVMNRGKKEGHAYLTYFCEPEEKWVVLDWCYWPNDLPIKLRPDYKSMEDYLGVWFSFNELYAWGKEADIRKAEVLK